MAGDQTDKSRSGVNCQSSRISSLDHGLSLNHLVPGPASAEMDFDTEIERDVHSACVGVKQAQRPDIERSSGQIRAAPRARAYPGCSISVHDSAGSTFVSARHR